MKRFFLIFSLLFPAIAFSQTNMPIQQDSSYLFKFFDETSLIGKAISVSDSSIIIRTKNLGEVTVKRINIKTAELLTAENLVMGQYWFPNPNATRYLFSPSAIPLKKGEGYYQNTYLFINSFYCGVSNNIAVGAGFEVISAFSGHPFFFTTVKASGEVAKQFYAGGGFIWANITDIDRNHNNFSFGALYSNFSFGNTNNNLSVNLGLGYDENNGLGERPLVTLSGMARISRKTYFITENWFVPVSDFEKRIYYSIISYGLRFSGEKIAVDLAFVNSRDIVDVLAIGIPYVGFAVKF